MSTLTTSIETQIRPTIIQIGLLGADTNGLDETHLAGRRSEILQTRGELDQPVDEGHGGIPPDAVVLAEGEGRDDVAVLAVRVEGGRAGAYL